MNVLECTDCGWRTFYEKERCPSCGCARFVERDPGVGELLARTTTQVTPDGVRDSNRLGLARFEGDVDVVAQLDADLDVGAPVRLVGDFELRERDDDVLVGSRLVPAEEA